MYCSCKRVVVMFVFFFFFKQKTAYEMLRSLVGSEMCIRDSAVAGGVAIRYGRDTFQHFFLKRSKDRPVDRGGDCLLYTSDAADDLLCVDLGGRRIIKKKKT